MAELVADHAEDPVRALERQAEVQHDAAVTAVGDHVPEVTRSARVGQDAGRAFDHKRGRAALGKMPREALAFPREDALEPGEHGIPCHGLRILHDSVIESNGMDTHTLWTLGGLALGAVVVGVAVATGRATLAPWQGLLTLPTQAFPDSGHPGAFVAIPPGVPADQRRVLVYFHGHSSNVEARGPALATALGAAQHPAVLVMPQLRWNAASGDAGQLDDEGGLRRLLADVLAQTPGLAGWDVDGVIVDVLAHSGGYVAAAAAVERGGMLVRGVGLFDALYGFGDTFAQWMLVDAYARLVNVYGQSTATPSLALARRLAQGLGQAAVLDTTGDGDVAALAADHRAVTLRTRVDHNDVPGAYLAATVDALAEG